MTHTALRLVILAVAAAVIGGCGDGDESKERTPTGALAAALAGLGGGGEGSLGVGWADPQLVERAGLAPEVIEDALAPNARSVVEAAPGLRREFGLDPLAADRLVSVGGSYAFGLRMDGVDGRALARQLASDGGRARTVGPNKVIDIGDYAVVPDALVALGIHGLGAFDALGRDVAVLAISDRARAALLGESDPLFDEPVYRAAAECLGDVVAARLIPDKLLLSVEVGVDQVAIGVTADSEVLCVLGGSEERATEIEAALRGALGPGSRDPVSHEPIGDSLRHVEVSRDGYDDVEVVRVEGELAAGRSPDYFFSTVATGSLVSLINGEDSSFLR
jgi:hypothetical protein